MRIGIGMQRRRLCSDSRQLVVLTVAAVSIALPVVFSSSSSGFGLAFDDARGAASGPLILGRESDEEAAAAAALLEAAAAADDDDDDDDFFLLTSVVAARATATYDRANE